MMNVVDIMIRNVGVTEKLLKHVSVGIMTIAKEERERIFVQICDCGHLYRCRSFVGLL